VAANHSFAGTGVWTDSKRSLESRGEGEEADEAIAEFGIALFEGARRPEGFERGDVVGRVKIDGSRENGIGDLFQVIDDPAGGEMECDGKFDLLSGFDTSRGGGRLELDSSR
jgi:hypothetical protein